MRVLLVITWWGGRSPQLKYNVPGYSEADCSKSRQVLDVSPPLSEQEVEIYSVHEYTLHNLFKNCIFRINFGSSSAVYLLNINTYSFQIYMNHLLWMNLSSVLNFTANFIEAELRSSTWSSRRLSKISFTLAISAPGSQLMSNHGAGDVLWNLFQQIFSRLDFHV
jgi:hypothetical protein